MITLGLQPKTYDVVSRPLAGVLGDAVEPGHHVPDRCLSIRTTKTTTMMASMLIQLLCYMDLASFVWSTRIQYLSICSEIKF